MRRPRKEPYMPDELELSANEWKLVLLIARHLMQAHKHCPDFVLAAKELLEQIEKERAQ